MTTNIGTFALNFTNDTTYRAFVQGIHDMLIAVGFTQTADTGQANLTTIPKPGVSSNSAPLVYTVTWPTGDSLWLKLTFGAQANSLPTVAVEYSAFGTDGASTLIRSRGMGAIGRLSSVGGDAVVRSHYACLNTELQTFNISIAGDTGFSTFGMQKRVDPVTLLPTASKDYTVFGHVSVTSSTIFGGAISTWWHWNYRELPAQTVAAAGLRSEHWCKVPYGITASPAGDKYLFPWVTAFPSMSPMPSAVSYIAAEIGAGTLFQIAPYGSTLRTYRATGLTFAANAAAAYAAALLWE